MCRFGPIGVQYTRFLLRGLGMMLLFCNKQVSRFWFASQGKECTHVGVNHPWRLICSGLILVSPFLSVQELIRDARSRSSNFFFYTLKVHIAMFWIYWCHRSPARNHDQGQDRKPSRLLRRFLCCKGAETRVHVCFIWTPISKRCLTVHHSFCQFIKDIL